MTETLILAAIGLQATYETQTMADTNTIIVSSLHYLRNRIETNNLKVDKGLQAIEAIWNSRYRHQALIDFKEAMGIHYAWTNVSILSTLNRFRERLRTGYEVFLPQPLGKDDFVVLLTKDKDGRLIDALLNCIWLEIYRTKKAPIKELKVVFSSYLREVRIYHDSDVRMSSQAMILSQAIVNHIGKNTHLALVDPIIEGYSHCFTLTLP
jgi:hypothetical protein